jgi:hypothetical protein
MVMDTLSKPPAHAQQAKANAAAESSSEVAAPTATDAVELKPQLLADQPLSDRYVNTFRCLCHWF